MEGLVGAVEGEFVTFLRKMDCKDWILFIFDGLAEPQISIAYDQMGFISELYKSRLFSSVSLDRLSSNRESSL